MTLRGFGLGLVFLLSATAMSQAAIKCDGAFQINSQGEFESPFCNERLLAKIAHVPEDVIRQNWSAKKAACRSYGSDNRITEFCATVIPRCTLFNC